LWSAMGNKYIEDTKKRQLTVLGNGIRLTGSV